MVKLAISTNDGKEIIDDHFGEGKFFMIYELRENGWVLVETRENTTGEEKEHGDPEKAAGIMSILKDIDLLVGYRMGPNVLRIKKKFLPVIVRTRSIGEALKQVSDHFEDIYKSLNEKNVILIIEGGKVLRVKGRELKE